MAKNKNATATVAIMALATLAAFGEAGTFAPLASVQPLVDAGHAELGGTTDASGNVAVRITEQGTAAMSNTAGTAAPTTAATASRFEIEDGIELTPKKRGRTGTTYPFDDLEVGKRFFVANTESKPDAVKSLASTVSSATARYAVPVMLADGVTPEVETVTVKQYKTDENGKRVKGEDGKSVVESTKEETRPKTKATRTFAVYAGEKNGAAGAWVQRTA